MARCSGFCVELLRARRFLTSLAACNGQLRHLAMVLDWFGLTPDSCLSFPEIALVRHDQGRQIHVRRRSESGWESAGQN